MMFHDLGSGFRGFLEITWQELWDDPPRRSSGPLRALQTPQPIAESVQKEYLSREASHWVNTEISKGLKTQLGFCMNAS